MKKILNLSFLPVNINLALLALRIIVALSLFSKHGWEKIAHFSEMNKMGMNPMHIGATPTLLYATFCDSICSILLLLGLFTRFASMFLVISMAAIFIVMHHGSFMGDSMDPRGDHAEVVWLYLGGFLTILFAGAGKYSLDAKLRNFNSTAPLKN